MDATEAWRTVVSNILEYGTGVGPRGRETLEVEGMYVPLVDMRRPVVRDPGRQLNYRFMAAEAYWILSGDDTVAGVAPWSKLIADFSDDGVKFFGAYGPPLRAQLPYVVAKLREDPATRQAALTIWRPSPPATRDVPCTVAMTFLRRHGRLNAHVFMRSSDAWLGLPYDIFNFSMVTHLVCAQLNDGTVPGDLHLVAASSHLYTLDQQRAREILSVATPKSLNAQPHTPLALWGDEAMLLTVLKQLRECPAGHDLRWWERPAEPSELDND